MWYTRCIGSWLLNTVKKIFLHHLLPPYNGALPIYSCFLAMFAVGSALTLWPLAKTGVFLCLKLGLLVKICEKKIFQKITRPHSCAYFLCVKLISKENFFCDILCSKERAAENATDPKNKKFFRENTTFQHGSILPSRPCFFTGLL